ncbi:MAG: nodulation protein NfeD [Candidatus Kapaibacteriales bacterium]
MIKRITLLLFAIGFTATAISSGKVFYVEIESGISPSVAEYIGKTLGEAEEGEYEAYILRLDTPGGLLDATRDIVSDLIESTIPTVVYIGPAGARAGSAGAFISMAADLVAMAPGTNIGAAHPVGLGGDSSDSSDTMTQKVTNDASALMRSIALKSGKNAELAEKMVRESYSISEDEAIENNIADYIAKDIDELAFKISGYNISNEKRNITLGIDLSIEKREMSWTEELLMTIASPNIAYIFILLAGYGVLIELYNPGSIFPGTIGVISALLAAYSLQMLPVSYVGLALLVTSVVLIGLEVFITSYGLLSLASIVCFFLGSIMLFDSPFGVFEVSMDLVYTMTAFIAICALGLAYYAFQSQKKAKANGEKGLIGEKGYSLSDFDILHKGKVRFHGENWKAVSTNKEKIAKGDPVEIVEIKDLTAFVKKALPLVDTSPNKS